MTDTAALLPATRGRRPLRLTRGLIIGAGGLFVIVAVAVLAPLVAPYSPIAQHLGDRLLPPTTRYLLGTDNLGRDILSRLIFGLRPSLLSGLAAVGLAAVAGTIIGLLAGYYRGWFDAVTGRILDLLVAWPAIFIAIALVMVVGPGPLGVVIAIGLSETPVFARVIRAISLANVAMPHIEAAQTMGASPLRIMRKHILPFATPPLIVQFAISAPQAVVAEASLSFLGLGTQPPNPSLGGMVSDSLLYLSRSVYLAVFPVVAIALLVLSLTLIADGLQALLDPRRSQRQA